MAWLEIDFQFYFLHIFFNMCMKQQTEIEYSFKHCDEYVVSLLHEKHKSHAWWLIWQLYFLKSNRKKNLWIEISASEIAVPRQISVCLFADIFALPKNLSIEFLKCFGTFLKCIQNHFRLFFLLFSSLC